MSVKRFVSLLFTLFLTALITQSVVAQTTEEAQVAPVPVSLEASHDAVLVGSFYPAAETAPALLLMHMNRGSRAQWDPILPDLLDAGYNVLAIDLRGQGESSGTVSMVEAINDVAVWLEWLRAQPTVDPARVAVMGGSVGANLAIVGCSNDPACVTVVALSPGVNYYRVVTTTALPALEDRPVLVVASRRDSPSGQDVQTLLSDSTGDFTVQMYTGGVHGTDMLTSEPTLIPTILLWLHLHLDA
ncbi:MAG: alpha/beta fold hydrolase [Anaerolineae bacterium]